MSSSFKRMLAFLLASAACWSLALTIVSIHWWHFFKSSCNSNKLLYLQYIHQFHQLKYVLHESQFTTKGINSYLISNGGNISHALNV